MQKALTLSVIILAFNEEDQLPACLDALAVQTVMPTEVIVVDNNSTDNTAAIARSYPFVKLVHEPIQGMIPARNKGFSVAKGDILARIDADARVARDWAERLYNDFANTRVMGVAGLSLSLLMPNTSIYSTLWSYAYLFWMRMQFNIPILWGSNMAIRRSAWQVIKGELQTNDRLVHEDQDMSAVLAKHGLMVISDTKLLMTSECQDKNEWPKYWEYTKRTIRTQRLHRERGSFKTAKKLYTPWQRVIFVLFVFIPFKSIFMLGMIISTYTAYLKQWVKDAKKPELENN